MTIPTTLRLGGALLYAAGPYAALLAAVEIRRGAGVSPVNVARWCSAGLAGFLLAAHGITAIAGLPAFTQVHAVVAGMAAVAFALAARRRPPRVPAAARADVAVLILPALAALLWWLPAAGAEAWLGGVDARFHHILSAKALATGRLATTWAPFAPIPVVYPQASHVATAWLAQTAGCPVHEAFHGLMVLAGAWTTSLVYLVAAAVFASSASAAWAALCYALLPMWGGIDYLRWGGLPNALGMALLLLVMRCVLEQADPDERAESRGLWVGAVTLAGVAAVHHYSALVAALTLAAGCLTADRRLLRALVRTGALGCALALPFAVLHAWPSARAGQGDALAFREPLITLPSCLRQIGPGLLAAFAAAMLAARRRAQPWDLRQLFILSWLAALVAAFVFLEYGVRFASLLAAGGRDWHTALTPSRMATDMVYPLSVLCGFLPAAARWPAVRRYALLAVLAAGAATAAAAWPSLARLRGSRDTFAAAAWIRGNVAADVLIVGAHPHLEYLTWRQTSWPPIPASEARNEPTLARFRAMDTLGDWLAWGQRSGRPVVFLLNASAPPPPLVSLLYSNSTLRLYGRRAEAPAP